MTAPEERNQLHLLLLSLIAIIRILHAHMDEQRRLEPKE
jgi:hypothetical protein